MCYVVRGSKNTLFLHILYIIVTPLCYAFLKRVDFYKAHRSEKQGVLWLASYPVCCDWPNTPSVRRKCYNTLTYCDACPGKTRPITNEPFVASTGDIITDYNDLGYVHTWRLFWQEKVDERFFNEKQSWQRLLQIAAESVFCCHSNSCNSSLALCAAEMSRKSTKLALALAFEVTGKENVDSQRRPSTGTFSIFFLVMETTDLATRLSLVSCQKGAWRRAFFSEKFNFFQLEKRSELQKKTPAVAF